MGIKGEDLGAKLQVAVSDRPSLRCGPVVAFFLDLGDPHC